MENLKIADKYKNIVRDFVQGLKDVYREDLISAILYGSAASGEFASRYSNLNLVIILRNTDPPTLKRASKLMRKFRMINGLFMTEEYVRTSTDVFPIEFLDMKENHSVLYGRDILKDIRVDTRNLRFQCEQELKAKLIKIKQAYPLVCGNAPALRRMLFASVTSILHILRNVLRVKAKEAAYSKDEVLRQLQAEFGIDAQSWGSILTAKKNNVRLNGDEAGRLLVKFITDLESIINAVDKI